MSFRNFKKHIQYGALSPLEETQYKSQSVLEDGTQHTLVVETKVNLCSPEYSHSHLPSREDYDISNQLASGVKMQSINTSNLISNPNIEAEASQLADNMLNQEK